MAASITYAHIKIICLYSGVLLEHTIHKLACDPEVSGNIKCAHTHTQTNKLPLWVSKVFICTQRAHLTSTNIYHSEQRVSNSWRKLEIGSTVIFLILLSCYRDTEIKDANVLKSKGQTPAKLSSQFKRQEWVLLYINAFFAISVVDVPPRPWCSATCSGVSRVAQ